MLAFDI